VGVTVYSLAYDLTEVCAPVESWPLAFNGFDLRQIADRLVTPTLGIATVFDGLPGAKFTKVSCEPDSTIHSVLVDLAQQRGYVLSDLPTGDLLFRSEAFTGVPVARLQGQPVGRVSAQFQPGSWYSRITGRASQKSGQKGSQFTEVNPLYRAEHPRSITISLDDTESADIPKAVRAAIGRMIASVATYTVEGLPGWRDPSGKLWQANRTVTLLAPEAMIYKETELLIRSVKLHQTAEGESASLELVSPGSFGGFLSLELPWQL
jgi:prophage tail gpP-like protein